MGIIQVSEVAAWRADNPPPSKVHAAFGGEWEIPSSMPAALWFWWRETFVDQGRDIADGITYAELDEVVELVPGLADHVRTWAQGGATVDEVYAHLMAITLVYLTAPSARRSRQGEARAATSETGSPPTSTTSPPSPEPRQGSTSPTSSEGA